MPWFSIETLENFPRHTHFDTPLEKIPEVVQKHTSSGEKKTGNSKMSSSSFSSPSDVDDAQSNFSKLPIHSLKSKIVEKILENRVTLIIGETGCGNYLHFRSLLLVYLCLVFLIMFCMLKLERNRFFFFFLIKCGLNVGSVKWKITFLFMFMRCSRLVNGLFLFCV